MSGIAYLGPPGSYSEIAALVWGDAATPLLPLATMPAVVTAVETGAARHGVLPIENVLEGGVTTTLDLLIHETALRISGETVVPIRHVLVARAGMQPPQVRVLYGHPPSLGQCRRFIERVLPGVATVASLSNSTAPVEALADERGAAAISTERAAVLAGAVIIARDIQDRAENVTRFIRLSHTDHPPTGDDKTSLCFGFSERDRPGILVDALQEFSSVGLNITRLESRPSKDVLGGYVFLVDLNGHRTDAPLAAALERVRRRVGLLKIFGSYPCWHASATAAPAATTRAGSMAAADTP